MIQAVPREFVSYVAPANEADRVSLDDIDVPDCQAMYRDLRGELIGFVNLETEAHELSNASLVLIDEVKTIRDLRDIAERREFASEFLAHVVKLLDAESGILYKMLESAGIEPDEFELEDYLDNVNSEEADNHLTTCARKCKGLSDLKIQLQEELRPIEIEFRKALRKFNREDYILTRSRMSFVMDDYLARNNTVLIVPALMGIAMQVGFLSVLGSVLKTTALRMFRNRTMPVPDIEEVDTVQKGFQEAVVSSLRRVRST